MQASVESSSQGRVLGGILLVAGCCIGAGMLGLPVLSAMAGFVPSVVMFFVSWLFMLCTGLLTLEVNLWFKDEVNIVSMAGRTLGNIGRAVAWVVFAFLFYSLLVAYVAGSGELFVDFFYDFTNLHLPAWAGSVICTFILAIMLYIGTLAVDRFNRLMMIGLIGTYLTLVMFGSKHIDLNLLSHRQWEMSFLALPAMIISFGFHNLIPSLTTYLKQDVKKLKLVIIIGSALPLIIYILWEFLILGLVPIEGAGGFKEALDKGHMATQALRNVVGGSWIVTIAQYFAFFAIVTSFVGVALSFVDFLSDGLHIKKTFGGKILLCTLVLLPPTFFSIVYPNIFLAALNYAGGFGAVILFGILPAAMVWSGRYYKNLSQRPLVGGGKLTLVLVILFSCMVIGLQLFQEL